MFSILFRRVLPSRSKAEDYNYQSGLFNDGWQAGSFDSLAGTAEIDFHAANKITASTAYRPDLVRLGTAGDATRPKFANGGTDFAVNNVYAGDWLNYTRNIPSNQYQIYLRSSAGAAQQVRLDRVTAGAKTETQTLASFGVFNVPSAAFGYAPLTDGNGRAKFFRVRR